MGQRYKRYGKMGKDTIKFETLKNFSLSLLPLYKLKTVNLLYEPD